MKMPTWITFAAVAALAGAAGADTPVREGAARPVARGAPDTVPVEELIAQVARRTGQQFVVDPRVRADVPLTGLDPAALDYDRLRALLRVHGVAAIQEQGFVTLIPDANSRQIPVRTYYDLGFNAADDEFVTVLLESRKICSAHTVPVLRPLMPQYAHLAALPPRSLIINDRAANARRIGELFQRLDQQADTEMDCEWPEKRASR